MGRKVRQVPAGWEHPKNSDGCYIPLFDKTFVDAAREWLDEVIAWDRGTHPDLVAEPELKAKYPFYWQWDGGAPNPKSYRPAFAGPADHFQMYEDTSEGTPISPVMESIEGLARWLADTGASRFGGDTASYEEWLRVCQGGFSGMIFYVPNDVATSGEPAQVSEPSND